MTIKSEKMLALALMYLNGDSARKIAKQVHMSQARVAAHMKSELFQVQVAELREQMEKDHVQAMLRRIDQEGLPSLQMLTDLRDGNIKAEPKEQKIRLDAAKFILGDLWKDRNMPKATPEAGGIRLSISEKVLQEMFAALQEVKAGPKPLRNITPIPDAEDVSEAIREAETKMLE